ncbi:glycoside hydrolase family 28 protein [Paraflavitalea pollutisoli]|uniref:glycoside hydrolase family 28 protein n=1 Tax=Paraflavitalea pollutisoli TaxID=3034143 RepID=UPI0023ED8D34|nr:glycosyl hydrolase family 28 protein [Paraflavitalea sp. H1-2-19X]
MIRNYAVTVLAVLMSIVLSAQSKVQPYPLLTGESSKLFTVSAGKVDIPVSSYKGIHYIRYGQQGMTELDIRFPSQTREVKISPAHDFEKTTSGIRVRFEQPGYHVLTLGAEKLFILADSIDHFDPSGKEVVDIARYQADATGKRLSTREIQRAIDETAAARKVLYFGPGIYNTGTLTIGSQARIYLSGGCLINGSFDTTQYVTDKGFVEANKLRDGKAYSDNGEHMTFSRLILVEHANQVRIWGRGIINGNGALVRKTGKPANLVRIRSSRNVVIDGISFFDPAAWNTHILYSDSVTIRNVKLINDLEVPNTDGFDPDASRHVLIQHCFAFCSDDNVAIKSTNNSNLLRDCENIRVEGCLFLTKKSALKVGTETKATYMRNISFENNYVMMADRGLTLYCYDGARFENIRFVNNYFEYGFPDFEKKAIHFAIKQRSGQGAIRNVLIKDCYFGPRFHSKITLEGLDQDHAIAGVVFDNVTLFGKKVVTIDGLQLQKNEYVSNVELKNE